MNPSRKDAKVFPRLGSETRCRRKVAGIHETLRQVFGLAGHDKIPTYLSADRMAQERIGRTAAVKKYRD